jgi:hypothetical protein
VPENSRRDAGHFGFEIFGEHTGSICDAVTICVFDEMDLLADHHEVAKIMRAVAVQILNLRIASGLSIRGRREHAAIKRSLVGNGLKANVVRNPFAKGSDIEVLNFPSRRLCDERSSAIVEADGDRVGHIDVAAPARKLQLCRSRVAGAFVLSHRNAGCENRQDSEQERQNLGARHEKIPDANRVNLEGGQGEGGIVGVRDDHRTTTSRADSTS